MKMPRDMMGSEFATLLKRYGYEAVRQKGSHIRMTTQTPKEHHLTIPNHNPLKIGTLSNILAEIATQRGVSKEDVMRDLFE